MMTRICYMFAALVLLWYRVASLKVQCFPCARYGQVSKICPSKRMATQDNVSDNHAKKKILVLGGDGFCGWPTSLHLSDQGHEVVIVDNLSRRKIDTLLNCDSLTPIESIDTRIQVWNSLLPNEAAKIRFVYLDIAQPLEYSRLVSILREERPDTIIHFAEQRSAPYSMKNSPTKRYTVNNNIPGTHNVLCAAVESGVDPHIVHLGTMGVYGYGTSGGQIPEGYIDVTLPNGKMSNILHPSYPGSVYHMTKCLDALMFQFYNKNDALRITDLHQGIVWGTNTGQTKRDIRLINRFDYDSDYGTVLNRFLMQSALKHPLTVYGSGGQTRAFIHISDTCRCVEMAVNNPPVRGSRVEIFNQVAETRRVKDLANMIAQKANIEIGKIENPRKEDAENELQVSNTKFCDLGWKPITLDEGLMDEVSEIAVRFKDRCNVEKILPSSFWNKERREASGKGTAAK